jgi:hypothetical protein
MAKEIAPLQKKNEDRQLSAQNGKGMMPPTLQLQASTDAPEKAPMDGGTVDKAPVLDGRGSKELDTRAHQLASDFTTEGKTSLQKFLIARELVLITHELASRGREAALKEVPDYTDEIWNVVGGPGDPFVSMIESYGAPYNQLATYEQTAKSLNPAAWDDTVLNKAYTSNKTGRARATNFDTSVDEARSMIGQKTTQIGKDGKKKEVEFSPKIQSGSEWATEKKQTHVVVNPGYQLTGEDLRFIIGESHVKQQGEDDAQINDTLNNYADYLNKAFRLAMIDTVQAQAAYLAHSAGETSLAKFSEGQTTRWQDDPSKLNYSAGAGGPMDYFRESDNAELRGSTGSVDPAKALMSKGEMRKKSQPEVAAIFGQTFIGRGPVQVTHDSNYVQTLIYLEEMAKKAKTPEDANMIWEAVGEIKRDPGQAANPKYAFLFSAAYMQKTGGLRAAGSLGSKVSTPNFSPDATMTADQNALFGWVSGGVNVARRGSKTDAVGKSVKHASTRKTETYGRAFERIKKGVDQMK